MYNRVRGQFDGVRGTLFYDHRSPETSSITVIIDASSLDTGSAHRDEHLRSDDFFDTTRPGTRRRASKARRCRGPEPI